jgi:hypothetical protein
MYRISRRVMLAAVLAAGPEPGRAAPPSQLRFAVLRNGGRIGDHVMSFDGPAAEMRVRTQVEMIVRLGPVPVYRYRHSADERWSGGRFSSLASSTDGNGRRTRVEARRTAAGVLIEGASGRIAGPPTLAPLTHWNDEVLNGPLFNPQDGKLLSPTVRRGPIESIRLASGQAIDARRWSLRGEMQIDDWYDEGGVWAALKGRLADGSTIEYRRF